MQSRLAKLGRLREMGLDPFENERYDRTHSLLHVHDKHEELADKTVRVAGRVISMRAMGKATFFHLTDQTGRLQVYAKKDDLGEEGYELVKLLDVGDFAGVQGFVFKTRTGEVSVHAQELTLLSKALRPLPLGKEKDGQVWYGLSDVEARYRQRYADLVVHPEVRHVFERRSLIISTLRDEMRRLGYIEVETPILQPLYGGAAARPFVTHHNALDIELYMRIAPELYLKRLVVGGFEAVFEIGKQFRNEGIDTRHNPEFTMMEAYEAYCDYPRHMEVFETVVGACAMVVHGSHSFESLGHTIDVTPPWPRLKLYDAIKEYSGIDFSQVQDEDEARRLAMARGVDVEEVVGYGKIVDEVLKSTVIPRLIQPTFLYEYPYELSPLSKRNPQRPEMVQRFQPFIAGLEMGNSFSELNDPLDQRERFQMQLSARMAGDEEAHQMDEDFLRALEYGMPPTVGLGLGVDRLCMLLLDQRSIRDVILFPQMRPEE
ncbi:MAG: lysine--tRNA ligase [Armatimonadetes bacterium]|nr:lysine--tRNA ligase [Armatimonadota bacterium]